MSTSNKVNWKIAAAGGALLGAGLGGFVVAGSSEPFRIPDDVVLGENQRRLSSPSSPVQVTSTTLADALNSAGISATTVASPATPTAQDGGAVHEANSPVSATSPVSASSQVTIASPVTVDSPVGATPQPTPAPDPAAIHAPPPEPQPAPAPAPVAADSPASPASPSSPASIDT